MRPSARDDKLANREASGQVEKLPPTDSAAAMVRCYRWRTQRRGGVHPPIESSDSFNCVFVKYTVQAQLIYSLNPKFSIAKNVKNIVL